MNRRILGCLGAIGLALAGLGIAVALNWDAVSKNLDEALTAQTEKTEATLFKWLSSMRPWYRSAPS